MSQDFSYQATSANSPSIEVGQLIYTSFQDCGFRMLMTSETPLYIQRSFVEKVVNTRWDPHLPPQSDFRGAYAYQSTSQLEYIVFGWLYYNGRDEFGRSGIPYFIAYYHLGKLNQAQLQLILNCIETGPQEWVEDPLNNREQTLCPLILSPLNNYPPARPGINITEELWQNSQIQLSQNQPIDWFMPQSSNARPNPQPPLISPNSTHQFQSKLQKTAEQSSGDPTVNTQQLEAILQELVNKTMGIQGAALVSGEGNPIVSMIGISENTSGILAGTILYMIRETNSELNWTQIESVTLKGPDSYVILSFCQSDVFLLVTSDKVPMGLVEGAVNRTIEKIKLELNPPSAPRSIPARASLMPVNRIQNHSVETNLSKNLPGEPEPSYADLLVDSDIDSENFDSSEAEMAQLDDDDSELTYRGRPTNA